MIWKLLLLLLWWLWIGVYGVQRASTRDYLIILFIIWEHGQGLFLSYQYFLFAMLHFFLHMTRCTGRKRAVQSRVRRWCQCLISNISLRCQRWNDLLVLFERIFRFYENRLPDVRQRHLNLLSSTIWQNYTIANLCKIILSSLPSWRQKW